MKKLLLLALLLTITGCECKADLVTLKDGRWVSGKVSSSGGKIVAKSQAGTQTYKRSEVKSVKKQKYVAPTKQPCQADFGAEFGTKARQSRDYVLAPKSKPRPATPIKKTSAAKKSRNRK